MTFLAPAVEWGFSADVYSDEQEKRVRQLLLGDSVLCTELPPFVERRGSVDTATYGQVVEGDSVQNVLTRFGPPYLSKPSGRLGFALRYRLQVGDRSVQVELHFDQQQKLLKKATVE